MAKKIFFFVFLVILLVASVSGLKLVGNESYKQFLLFEPLVEQSFTYQFIGEGGTQDYVLSAFDVQGNVSRYFVFPEKVLRDVVPNKETEFIFLLQFPDELDPGLHEAWVGVTETGSDEGALEGVSNVNVRVFVRSLFADPFVEWSLSQEYDAGAEELSVLIDVENWWNEDMEDVSAVVRMRQDNRTFGDRRSASVLVKRGESAQIVVPVSTAAWQSGRYHVEADLVFEGERESKTLLFELGKKEISLVNTTYELYTHSVNAFDVMVRNEWNAGFKGVKGDVEVWNGTDVLYSSKIPPRELRGFQTLVLEGAYIDTKYIPVGMYEAKVRLKYEGREDVHLVSVEVVNDDTIRISEFALITIILLLLLLLILQVVFGGKKEKGKK